MKNQLSSPISALVLVVLSGPAFAQALRLPQAPDYAPPPLRTSSGESGWYLRGDVGANGNRISGLAQDDLARNGGGFIAKSISNSASVGVGAGYRVNSNVRLDATLELRTGATLKATDNVRILNQRGQEVADLYTQYNAGVSSNVALVNAYWDIGTFNGLTPFVGASVGIARNTVSGLTSVSNATINNYSATAPYALTGSIKDSTSGYAAERSRYSFAWGLTAGLSYVVNDRLTLEMAYRYLDLGKNAASDIINCTCDSQGQPLKISRLTSNDLKLGMRWNFGEAPRPVQSQYPIVTKY